MYPYQLAHASILHCRAPVKSPEMWGFVEQLNALYALADQAPGFVWRLKGNSGNATDVQTYDDPLVLVNLSVWTSAEALKAHLDSAAPLEVFRRRRDWFHEIRGETLALWWIAAGDYPQAHEGKGHIDYLNEFGHTLASFSFKKLYAGPRVRDPEEVPPAEAPSFG